MNNNIYKSSFLWKGRRAHILFSQRSGDNLRVEIYLGGTKYIYNGTKTISSCILQGKHGRTGK